MNWKAAGMCYAGMCVILLVAVAIAAVAMLLANLFGDLCGFALMAVIILGGGGLLVGWLER